jgi:hypothetical protein
LLYVFSCKILEKKALTSLSFLYLFRTNASAVYTGRHCSIPSTVEFLIDYAMYEILNTKNSVHRVVEFC